MLTRVVGSNFIVVITNCSRFGDAMLLLLSFGSLLDKVVKTGELELPLLPRVHAGVEVEVAPLGVEELAVPGERAFVGRAALDHGQ